MSEGPKREHKFSGSPYEDLAGYARAVVVGSQIYVSGTVGQDHTTGTIPDGAEAQAELAFDVIETALVEAASGLHDVVRVRVYLTDPADLTEIAGVVKRRVGFTYPANTTVCTALVVAGAKVEIETEAIRGSGTPRA